MLFFSLLLSFAVASLAISGGLDSTTASKIWRSKARDEFAVKVDKGTEPLKFYSANLQWFNVCVLCL